MDNLVLYNETKKNSKIYSVSIYDRYISFEKNISLLLFEKGVEGLDVLNHEDGIIFVSGDMFKLRKKHNNAIIYSKPLVDFLKNRFLLPDDTGAQKVYLQIYNDHFLIPTNSHKFLQIPTKK